MVSAFYCSGLKKYQYCGPIFRIQPLYRIPQMDLNIMLVVSLAPTVGGQFVKLRGLTRGLSARADIQNPGRRIPR